VKSDSAALVDVDGWGVFEVLFGCGVGEEKMEDVRVGGDSMAVVVMVPDCSDVDRLDVDILVALVKVEGSTEGLLDTDSSDSLGSWSPLVIYGLNVYCRLCALAHLENSMGRNLAISKNL
jgi:hypothetical protein